MSTKDTNPKDAVGTKKWRQYCTVPTTIIWELGVAMLEGARKYGRHNYRVAGVRASVYIDAAKGHIDQWWEGEDIDAESGLSHITKAMASLAVLRDAMINDMVNDDRPPKCNLDRVRDEMQAAVEGIFERFPDAVAPYTELGEMEKQNDWSGTIEEFTPLPSGPHTITVNGLECYRGDQVTIQIDELAMLADIDLPITDLHLLSVFMQCDNEPGFTLRHGNAFTTYDGTRFTVTMSSEKEHTELEADFLERRLADPDDDTVLTKQEARDASVGFDDFCKDTKQETITIIVNGVDHEWPEPSITMAELMHLASLCDGAAEDLTVTHYDPVTKEENGYVGDYQFKWDLSASATFKLEVTELDPVEAMEKVLEGQGVAT